ncbi:hypothetical protein M427DRAFT_46357 [Gonapodya prolifera JEL478]|uniref:MYND-type domain-containing protein n=1 Tax=Gonapodya prolifera (strain JEL478) TaxID=1344416 RepID=A0A139A6Z9_GONPJ|nr:hypothetical protein M427DRAFT_46357 [Gonapodya prolifera JEL478]|eukprot:KXS12428.1 hypothetical protein M427DRAFT_46357 [Gonapodya prolifera JEL478]
MSLDLHHLKVSLDTGLHGCRTKTRNVVKPFVEASHPFLDLLTLRCSAPRRIQSTTSPNFTAPEHSHWTGLRTAFSDSLTPSWSYLSSVDEDVANKVSANAPTCTRANISGDNLFLCKGCLVTRYCSTQCQKEHWKWHRGFCKKQSSQTDVDTVKVEDFGGWVPWCTKGVKAAVQKGMDWTEFGSHDNGTRRSFVIDSDRLRWRVAKERR